MPQGAWKKEIRLVEKRTILVADDARINRRALKVIYDSRYNLIEAEDGQEAIELLDKHGEEFDLVLLDINMPRKSGFDVLDYMRENNLLPQIPVIIITSSVDQEDELRAFTSGASEVIHKPFMPEIVLRRSENLIELYSSKKTMEKELILSREKLNGFQQNDTLTGLLNMKAFQSAANKTLQEAFGPAEERAYDQTSDGSAPADSVAKPQYQFVYINITNFKFYNVMNGLEAGDQILQTLASRILAVDKDLLCSRLGQDHFVVMSSDDAETIRTEMTIISEEFDASYGQYGMQLKVGMYSVHSADEKADVASELAKLACDAIRNSNETFCEYTDDLRRKVELRSYAIQHIDEALSNHYIEVYYQPVVRTITGKTCSLEALARWNDPKMGFLSPGDFIPALEQNYLVSKLDLYILRETCKIMKQAAESGQSIVPVSFNFSQVDFMTCNLLEEINGITNEYNIPHDLICIEITETAFVDSPERMKQEIERFQQDGYQVWMDDFGSGYSSLNVLKDYQFDEIKLDMKFMASFDEKSKAIVKAIISMAKRIGIQTLAEGVETKEQYEFLRYIGCEKVQGYFYSRPLPVADLMETPHMSREQVESADKRDYYERISASDFVTEKAHAIFEYDGKMYRFMYLNKPYEEALRSTGITDRKQILENINSPMSPVNQLYNDLRVRCTVGGEPQSIVYSLRDHYIRLNVRCIAQCDNKSAFEVEMIDLTGTDAEMTRSKLDKIGRRLYGMFDIIFEVDLSSGESEVIRQGDYGFDVPQEKLREVHTIREMNRIMGSKIHPDDLEQFWKFADHRTLKDRIKKEGRVYVTDYFRIKQADGRYVRKAFRIMYRSDFDNAIYTEYYVPIEDERVIGKVLSAHKRA